MVKYFIFIISLIFFSYSGLAQLPTVNLCLGEDATVCQGQPVVITNCGGGSGGGSGGVFLNAPTSVSLSDDSFSGVVNLGFTFSFYNANYTQCVIGSNGVVSFNLTQANGYCPWALGGVGPLPSVAFTAARNGASPIYADMNPGVGGQVQYQTIGTAPNRRFVVIYKEVPNYSCGGCNYHSLIFNETSNNIEYHIGNKPPCPSWNGGLAIQATENSAGTVAHATPGRNNTLWPANQDGKLYTPTSPTNTANYTISTIPYVLVSTAGTSMQWQNTLGTTFPYNAGVLNVNVVPPGTTGYFLIGSACGTSIGSVTGDTTWLTRVNSSVTATSTPDFCSAGIGSVTAVPGAGDAPFTFLWPTLGGQTTPTVLNVLAGTYTVQMNDANGCPSTATITVGDTPAAFTGTTTLVSCAGGSNGTATAIMTPSIGNLTYLWNDPLAQTTQVATGLSAGNYSCTITSDAGCIGTFSVTVSEIPEMIATITNQTDVTCNSGNDGMIDINVILGTPGYTYSWNNSTSTLDIANDLSVGNHTITITDLNGCVISITGTLLEPNPLSISFLTPPTQICPEDDISLSVAGAGGSSAYLFTWTENGTEIGTGTSILVDPIMTNTQYCVKLTEACGSPYTDSCTVITFPTPIVPNILPNKTEDCIPGYFEFENTSSNSSEIATTYFEFSDGNSYMEIGTDSTSNTFDLANVYSCNITITSIYGCVYTALFNNLIEVKPLPIADFTFSSNPITIFETGVQLQDRSTADVIAWEWFSPGSSPTTSLDKNPSFVFPVGELGDYPITLLVTTEHGCIDTITYIMHVIDDVMLYAPNTFTPNGDEHNQSWGINITGIDIYNFDLFIFNRWGEVIWESHDPLAKWDGSYNGQLVQEGTYIWKVQANDLINDDKHEFSGYIHMIR